MKLEKILSVVILPILILWILSACKKSAVEPEIENDLNKGKIAFFNQRFDLNGTSSYQN